MVSFVENLGDALSEALSEAEEIWVAVALMTKAGLDFLEAELSADAKRHYILGTDLPTDPLALSRLNRQQFSSETTVAMYHGQSFFHPKVYLIRTDKKWIAFIGSANCTKNGLTKNVELSFIIRDQKICQELLEWYEGLLTETVPLTSAFIKDYRLRYKKRMLQKRADEALAKEVKKELKQEYTATMRARSELIKMLKDYRKETDYQEMKADRDYSIKEIRKSLDYPNFRKIDLDAFYNIWALGHLIAIYKPRVEADLPKFRRMLRMLIDENIDIAIRYNAALKGDYAMYGVSDALVSKVLNVHRPKKYFVKNGMSTRTLQSYGLVLPSGISVGEKYKATCTFLQLVGKESKMDNLSIMDYYLYREAEELG